MLSQQVTIESSRCYLACLGYSSSEQSEISALIELPLDQREMDDKQKLISKVSGIFTGDQYCGKKEVVQSKGIGNMEVDVRFYLCPKSISQAACSSGNELLSHRVASSLLLGGPGRGDSDLGQRGGREGSEKLISSREFLS